MNDQLSSSRPCPLHLERKGKEERVLKWHDWDGWCLDNRDEKRWYDLRMMSRFFGSVVVVVK